MPTAHGPAALPIEDAARAIEAEFKVAMGSEARVTAACCALRSARQSWSDPAVAARLEEVAALVAGQTGPLVLPLFNLLEEVARGSPHPWGLFVPMLRAGPPELAARALDALLSAIDGGRFIPDESSIASVAAIAETPGSPLTDRPSLEKLARLMGGTTLRQYLHSADASTRRLAARVLDLTGRPPAPAVARAVLGKLAHEFLEPYLEFTRATHADLLAIAAAPESGEPRAMTSLRAAEAACGAPLLREAIAALGWGAVNLGLEARRLLGVSIGGGIPLVLSPEEAALFDGCPGAAWVFERTLFVAHGSRPEAAGAAGDADVKVARFRASNLAHARALAEFLDLAPLTRERVERLLAAAGELVADFVALFPAERDECRRVLAVYDAIKMRIADATALGGGPGVAAEVSRLIQPFEDPASAETIRTLHGLKRYLHQRGLRLGFQLVQSGRHATRTVSIAVATGDRVTHVVRPVEYADFDPDAASARGDMPYAVRVVVEGFARQLVHGEEQLPSVRVFCYGNEVHYFISFRNHPAFVRVDYSPPFAGGMIDLEYYGVSKYELSHHPNVSLDGVRAFFRRLDFDVNIENTRIHARYDKERARDLADLCSRAEALFRLAPYLMDIDWVLGNLDLPRDAREAAMHAWADRLARWGVLPLRQVLSADRRAILLRDAPHPTGPRERTWRGDPPYEDRLTPEAGGADAAAHWMRDALRSRGLDATKAFEGPGIAQVPFETAVLAPLREGALGGERRHEASRFATLVAERGEPLVEAARLASVLVPLDRFLQFETIGRVSGRVVQRAAIALPGRRLSVAVLREDSGAPGLALVDGGPAGAPAIDAAGLALQLRSHNYPIGDPTAPEDGGPAALAVAFSTPGRDRSIRPIEGERLARGVRAAPGVAAGLVRFGTAHRAPSDIDGAVLVTDRLSPDDSPFLVRAAGVVCTGGGVLSHAGLLAAQFGKPALVIDARWTAPADAGAVLQFYSFDYEETESVFGPCTVAERRGFTRREECLRDGDLVEVSADERVLRVLGQDRETLALLDALRGLETSEARLVTAAAPEQILIGRGRRVHALHHLERLLVQLARPDLVGFAIRRLLREAAASAACAGLLRILLEGRASEAARSCLADRLALIAASYEDTDRIARQRIPFAADPFEVIALRLAVTRDADTLDAARSVLQATGAGRVMTIPESFAKAGREADRQSLDDAAMARLCALQEATVADLHRAAAAGDWSRVRHTLRATDRDSAVLGTPPAPAASVAAPRDLLQERDRAVIMACEGRRVLTAADGGAELQPLIGGKAANLGEVARLDPDAAVPAWFAITNAAFQQALMVPAAAHGGVPAGTAITEVLSRGALDARQQARTIAAIWERMTWPEDLEAQIRSAYRDLTANVGGDTDAPRSSDGELLVAVRSSAFEEDRPEATRAGEFDTFLFVAGEDALLAHVKRAWSGLWTPRAIHNRAMLGIGSRLPGGGILVQRIVDARAAGVVQTINVADARPWEMAIDVAFGLGEGVVSGRIAADHVTVVKGAQPGGALRFRYATADKRDRVVFDARRGSGTVRADTLYHQRMRPALEYAQLEALVHTAERLERGWREALDIEFAIDAQRLWVLQARPVPAFHAAWRETARHYPFAGRRHDT